MIEIELSRIFNGHAYYSIEQDGRTYKAFGPEMAAQVVREIRKDSEEVKIKDIKQLIGEHDQLAGLLS